MNIPDDFSCHKCKRKYACKVLCPPMQHYSKQDEVEPGKERPLPPEVIGIKPFPNMPEPLSTGEEVIKLFYYDRLTQQEISARLTISRQYVSKITSHYKNLIAAFIRQNIKK